MGIWELEKLLGVDVKTCLDERFMGSEAMYVRFLKKLLDDKNLVQLTDAVQCCDYKDVELKAHTLKGLCATLGLDDLSRLFGQMVCMVRSGDIDESRLQGDMQLASEKMAQALQLINRL